MAPNKRGSIFKKAVDSSLKTNDQKEKKESLKGSRSSRPSLSGDPSSKPKPRPRHKKPWTGPKLKSRSKRGVVFLSHLPHGFYEEQIKEYFSQFGKVTSVKLQRSEKTGRSKGYGYVQFVDREVAEIAANTMNKYLMINRIINASLLTPKKGSKINFSEKRVVPIRTGGTTKRVVRPATITPQTCARAENRKQFIAKKNATQHKKKHQRVVNQERKKLRKIQAELGKLGVPKLEMTQDLLEEHDP